MSREPNRNTTASTPDAAWLARRIREFEGRLGQSDDIVLGPSGRLLRESVNLERAAFHHEPSRLTAVPDKRGTTGQDKGSKSSAPIQPPLVFEVPKS